MFHSQDDFDFTPRETAERTFNNHAHGGSPARKRGRGKMFQFLESSSNRFRDENEPNGLMMTQDSPAVSQFSQDFADRLGHLNMRSSQEDSFLMAPIDTSSMDNFSIPTAPSSKGRKLHVLGNTVKKVERIETEKQIDIRRPHLNPFIAKTQESTEHYFSNVFGPMRKLNKMWISAFKERSRYLSDFEELTNLGEGTFSSVCVARHRLDGTLYAIKKIKERISSESQAKMMLREACAFAALANCPNLVHYYGCWIEESQLYLQLELCHVGSLEDLISPHPSQCSIMHVRNHAHYFPQQQSLAIDTEAVLDTAQGPPSYQIMQQEDSNSNSRGLAGEGSESFMYMPHSQFSQSGFSGATSSSWEATNITANNNTNSNPSKIAISNSNNNRINSNENSVDTLFTPRNDTMNAVNSATVASQSLPVNRRLLQPQSRSTSINMSTDDMSSSYLSQQPTNAVAHTQPPQLFCPPMSISPQVSSSFSRLQSSSKGISEALSWLILHEVAKTLVYMHAHGLVHLDLRPANFFMKAVSKPSTSSSSSIVPAPSSLFATVMSNTATNSLSQSLGKLQLQPLTIVGPAQNSANHKVTNMNSSGIFTSTLSISIPPPPPSSSSSSTMNTVSTPMMTPVNTQHHQSQHHQPLFPPLISATPTTHSSQHHNNHNAGNHPSGVNHTNSAASVQAWNEYYSRRQRVETGLLRGDFVIRVGDLGLCRGVFETTGFIQEGETRYCPRELINLNHNSLDLTKADIFSLAASVYELCLGRFLGASEEGIDEWHSIRDGMLATEGWFSEYSPSLTGLIGKMLHPDPKKRPSALEVVQLTKAYVSTSSSNLSSRTTATSPTTQNPAEPLANMSTADLVAMVHALQIENQQLRDCLK